MKRGLITIIFFFLFLFTSVQLESKTAQNAQKQKSDDLQRTIQLIEYRTTTKSNVEFIISNLGVLAHKDSSGTGLPGCIWPRGSQNSYIYGQGICFGAKKVVGSDTNKLFHISYNPNNGKCWTVSGRIEDGTNMLFSKRLKYQVYFSNEFDKSTGEPLDPTESINWPIWKKDNTDIGKIGQYIFDEQERDLTTYFNGPAMLSNQDVHCVFKDTQLSNYENSQDSLTTAGYPMKIQYEQTTYLFDDEAYKDMIILKYKIINMSTDSLRDCWFGMVTDNDLKLLSSDSGQVNDDARFYVEDQTLNLGITWSETNEGELGKSFGYIGNSLLESPAVDQNGYLKKDKSFYSPSEQLGLKTFKLFPLQIDTSIFNNLYDNLSSGSKSIELGPEDLRILLATGPFHLNPNDTATCAFMINFAHTAGGGEADGSTADAANLITSVRNGRDLYYNRHLTTAVIEENQNSGKMEINKLYPNPSDYVLNVEFNSSESGIIKIDVSDLIGNKISSYTKDCSKGLNYFTLSTMNYTSGTYVLEINNLNNMQTGKISKLFSVIR